MRCGQVESEQVWQACMTVLLVRPVADGTVRIKTQYNYDLSTVGKEER
jgi:hypothetical protein